MKCPACNGRVFRKSEDGTKIRARTRVLVIRKSGEVEINCSTCKTPLVLPLELKDGPFNLEKAQAPRLILRKG